MLSTQRCVDKVACPLAPPCFAPPCFASSRFSLPHDSPPCFAPSRFSLPHDSPPRFSLTRHLATPAPMAHIQRHLSRTYGASPVPTVLMGQCVDDLRMAERAPVYLVTCGRSSPAFPFWHGEFMKRSWSPELLDEFVKRLKQFMSVLRTSMGIW